MRRRLFPARPAQTQPGRVLELEAVVPASTPDHDCDCPQSGGCDISQVGWAPTVRRVESEWGPYIEHSYPTVIDWSDPDARKIRTGLLLQDEWVPLGQVEQHVAYAVGPATAGVRWEAEVSAEPWPEGSDEIRADTWDYVNVSIYGAVVVVTQEPSPSPSNWWHATVTLRAYCGDDQVGELVWQIEGSVIG